MFKFMFVLQYKPIITMMEYFIIDELIDNLHQP